MKKLSLVAFLAICLPQVSGPVWGVDPQQVDDNFYTGKIKGRDLWFGMERVTLENHHLWEQYATVQSQLAPLSNNYSQQKGKPFEGTVSDGADYFKEVLKNVSFHQNEIWIAYVTKSFAPKRISSSDITKAYEKEGVRHSKISSFAENIEMFVSITSSPQALITSHMGISASFEAYRGQNRAEHISLDLHSFAAKVMRMRNPDRRYMVNAPNFRMGDILRKQLPEAVFSGTREMQQTIKERQSVSPEAFQQQNPDKIAKVHQDISERAIYECESVHRRLEKSGDFRKTCTKEELLEYANLPQNTLLEIGPERDFIVSETKKAEQISKEIKDKYCNFLNPYALPPLEARETQSARWLALMHKNPPILSVDGPGGTHINSTLTIFDHQNPTNGPWLKIEKKNKEYQWIFEKPFQPGGITHDIAVDLVKLADCRELES